MSYQRAYINQIYSNSVMGQVAHMWRNKLLCDAVIKTGILNTKAHRLVLIAACPMLQHMENAAVGSHLEVRLSADIKQSSVTTFLQYLYEGFMMLTEDNCRDVEKIGKLLQVDSVVKCCVDFYKCLNTKTGGAGTDGSKFDNQDQLEFKYVRATDLQKTLQESALKRSSSDNIRPASPKNKRKRVQRSSSPPENYFSTQGQNHSTPRVQSGSGPYGICHSPVQSVSFDNPSDMFSRVHSYHSLKAGSKNISSGFIPTTVRSSSVDVNEIIEDSIEVVNMEPRERDSEGWPKPSDLPPLQKSMSIAVSSQQADGDNVQVLDVDSISRESPRRKKQSTIILSDADTTPRVSTNSTNQTSEKSSVSPQVESPAITMVTGLLRSTERPEFVTIEDTSSNIENSCNDSKTLKVTDSGVLTRPQMHQPLNFETNPKGRLFAAGSSLQAKNISVQGTETQTSARKEISRKNSVQGRDHRQHEYGSDLMTEDVSSSSTTKSPAFTAEPDLSIVKVEQDSEAGIDMTLEMQSQSFTSIKDTGQDTGQDLGRSIDEQEDWEEQEDFSNEGSNISVDQSATWQEGMYHGFVEREASTSETNFQCNQCKKCGEIFSDGYSLVQHLREVEKRKFCEMCKICGEVFFLNRTYRYHLQVKHNLATNCPRCEICGSYFQDNYNLKRHIAIHSTEKLFACSKCETKFRQRHSMKSHEKYCRGKH